VKSIGECLKIHSLAKAISVYAQKIGFAQEAQDTCAKIVVLAERRIGQELIEAQKRGELARRDHHPGSVPSGDTAPATHEEIGISRRRAHEFRQMAELSDADIEETMSEAKQRGRSVTNADFKRKAARREKPPVIPPRPDHLNQLSLWLRNGPGIIRQFANYREALSLASRFSVHVDPNVVREISEFMAELDAALNADRAAWSNRASRSTLGKWFSQWSTSSSRGWIQVRPNWSSRSPGRQKP